MSVKFFVTEENIPNDGSKEIIEVFNQNVDFSKSEIYIYPDVHYKKGSRVVNGMLIRSSQYIFPACLGVENCGFIFGKIYNASIEDIQESFNKYAKKLKSYDAFEFYSKDYVRALFKQYLEKDFDNNKVLYDFLGINDPHKAYKLAIKSLTKDIMEKACHSLCSLGGGNHFFEVHRVEDVISEESKFKKNDLLFILHSDSISVGDIINLRFSNLSELDFLKNTRKGRKHIFKTRVRQFTYFLTSGLFFKNPLETYKLIYSQKDYRTIDFNSAIGKALLFEHNLATLFGEMNRDIIIQNWAKENNLNIEIQASHNHDSVTLEKNGSEYNVFHRNGVQYLGQDEYFILPSAMGAYSYILSNPKNQDAFFSANHGVGRVQDKHIARDNFNEKNTIQELEAQNIKLYHIGQSNIAEQNYKAFKEVDSILLEMNRQKLGVAMAKTRPIVIMKG